MMSILLFTFASWLHCHPVPIGSVSLLPVANVVSSLVLKVPFVLTRKSRTKPEAVKPAGRATVVPDASKKLNQSNNPLLVPPLLMMLPSSSKARSCTASTVLTTTMPIPTAITSDNRTPQRRTQLPFGPTTLVFMLITFLTMY